MVQNRLSSFFDWAPVHKGSAPLENTWAPLIDVLETGDEYLVRADLPGVSRRDLTVTLDRGELVIKGTRRLERFADGTRYLMSERPSGAFTRTVELPSNANASYIRAEFKDGVLKVRVAKDVKSKPRAVTVKAE